MNLNDFAASNLIHSLFKGTSWDAKDVFVNLRVGDFSLWSLIFLAQNESICLLQSEIVAYH